jgi:hypothetical protein
MELITSKNLAKAAGISVPYVYLLEKKGVIESVLPDSGKHIYEIGAVAAIREYLDRPRSGRARDELGRFQPEIEY